MEGVDHIGQTVRVYLKYYPLSVCKLPKRLTLSENEPNGGSLAVDELRCRRLCGRGGCAGGEGRRGEALPL
jgi:hypothetical protein